MIPSTNCFFFSMYILSCEYCIKWDKEKSKPILQNENCFMEFVCPASLAIVRDCSLCAKFDLKVAEEERSLIFMYYIFICIYISQVL